MSGTWTSRARALPSLGAALGGAADTFRRFPTVLIAAAVATAAAICDAESLGPDAIQLRLLAAASLGLPLLTAVTIAGEERPRAVRLALQAAGVLVLALFWAAWPGWTWDARGLHYTHLLAAFALMAGVLPFARTPRQNAFWQFNRAVIVRLAVSAVAAGIAYAGIALALLAADKLFGVDVPPTGYFRVFVLVGLVFTSWFFLGGVPRDLDALEGVRDYPAVLRVFAQYILTPLVALYLVILTVYLAKVVVLWDWPSGWIGWLVSGVACAGIAALLLVQPIAAEPDQKWIAAFARDFWLAILPAIVMLWLAVWQRVHQYGITEPRYFLIVLSLWLVGIALYFRLAKAPRVTMIPASLATVAVLALGGPWSAYAVARASQTARLSGVLERTGVLAAGRVDRAKGARMGGEDARQVSEGVRYLVNRHGVAAVGWLVTDSVTGRLTRLGQSGEDAVRTVLRTIGVPYVAPGASALAAGESFTLSAAESFASVPLAGYDALVPIRRGNDTLVARDTGLTARLESGLNVVRIRRGAAVLLDVPLDSMTARALGARGPRRWMPVAPALLRTAAANPTARATIVVRGMDGVSVLGKVRVTEVRGYALVAGTKR